MRKQSEDNQKTDVLEDSGLEMLDMNNIGKKTKRKKTMFDYVRYVIMVVASIVFVVSGYQIYDIISEYAKGEKTYENVMSDFGDETGQAVETTGAVVHTEGFVRYNPDFTKLTEANVDVKGWIQFEGIEEINYPILQHTDDNNYYLKKMWNHEENTAGSIFMDVYNTSDFSDYNTFIYGHNMKNLSMFGRLKEYKQEEFYKGKEYFWIYTPTANYQYQIFSVHEVKADGGFFKTFQDTSDEYAYYVQECKKASRYDTGVEVSGEDKIVTLSTCTPTGDNWRFIVHGKLVGTEIKK